VRDLLATAGSFVLLEALLLGLTRLVLDPKPPRHLVLAIGPARKRCRRVRRAHILRCVQWALRSGQRAAKGQHVGAGGTQCPSPGNVDLKFKDLPSRAAVGPPASDCRLTGNEFTRVDDRSGSVTADRGGRLSGHSTWGSGFRR
jgi:hypothetical protein